MTWEALPECNNYLLSKLRVKSQHTSGILNGRWGSLQELRVGLASDAHVSFAMDWILACCVLHNICFDEPEMETLTADPAEPGEW